MLTDPLFKFLSVNHTDGLIIAALQIDTGHEIFNGHFPDQPVVPGANMVQLVKDVLERALKVNVQLQIANNLKFLQVIDPREVNHLQLTVNYTTDDNLLKVSADLLAEENVYFKFKGVFTILK